MRDLTQGSIPRHIVAMAVPIGVGLLVQTLHYLVDLYFVARLGGAALAGVSAAGTVFFIVLALTQVLSVGTVALISHAVGRDNQPEANTIFNQSLVLATLLGAGTLLGGLTLAGPYMQGVGADQATTHAGLTYLRWYIPGLALQFALAAMSAALRGTGIVKPTMVVQMFTVILNILLAPILIAGWGTGYPLGVAGAALGTTISIAAGVIMLWVYFIKLERYVKLNYAQCRPRLDMWRQMLGIGLPAGGEFGLLFFYMALIYWAIQDFGAAAQAGFGLGQRVVQSIFLPAMAISFAAPAVAGQNFGAMQADRVRQTFRVAALMGSGTMVVITILCQLQPVWLLRPLTGDTDVLAVGTQFLRIISWNFVATGVIFTCSGMFQALGNTWPAFLSMASRLLLFAAPVVWLSTRDGFAIGHVWFVSVVSVWLQMLISLWLMRRELNRRLNFA